MGVSITLALPGSAETPRAGGDANEAISGVQDDQGLAAAWMASDAAASATTSDHIAGADRRTLAGIDDAVRDQSRDGGGALVLDVPSVSRFVRVPDEDAAAAAIVLAYGARSQNERDAAALWTLGSLYVPRPVVAAVSGSGNRELMGMSSPQVDSDVPWRSLIAEFVRGYRDAGGKPEYERHFVDDVIPCESDWQLDPNSPIYFGLAQFVWSTWLSVQRVPEADFRDPYEQGWAVAVNARDNDPAWQWPTCWTRGGW